MLYWRAPSLTLQPKSDVSDFGQSIKRPNSGKPEFDRKRGRGRTEHAAVLSHQARRAQYAKRIAPSRRAADALTAARSLDGAARDAADEAVEEKIVRDRHRDACDQRRGHQFAPVEDVAADEVGRDPQGDGLFLR